MITGQDGILNKAMVAKENTNSAAEVEKIELAVMPEVIHKEIYEISEVEMQNALKDYTVSKIGTDVFKVINNNEKVYYINSDGKVIDQEKTATLENLQIGDIVEYYTKEGRYIPASNKTGIVEEQVFETRNGKIKCIVLDKDESGNIRIIPMNSAGKVTFAGWYGWDASKTVLNNISALYHNEDYSIGSISAGGNENYEIDAEALKNIYDMGYRSIVTKCRWMTCGNGQKIVNKDESKLKDDSDSVWIAYRYYNSSSDKMFIKQYEVERDLIDERLYDGTWNVIYMNEKGYIPIITLKNDIKVYGVGTENNPYNFIPAN